MYCFQPPEIDAVVKSQATEHAPLRAGPGASPITLRTEDELRDVGGEDTEKLLAFQQSHLGLVLLAAIAKDLDETSGPIGERHEESRCPEHATVLAPLPAFVFRLSVRKRRSPLRSGSN